MAVPKCLTCRSDLMNRLVHTEQKIEHQTFKKMDFVWQQRLCLWCVMALLSYPASSNRQNCSFSRIGHIVTWIIFHIVESLVNISVCCFGFVCFSELWLCLCFYCACFDLFHDPVLSVQISPPPGRWSSSASPGARTACRWAAASATSTGGWRSSVQRWATPATTSARLCSAAAACRQSAPGPTCTCKVGNYTVSAQPVHVLRMSLFQSRARTTVV